MYLSKFKEKYMSLDPINAILFISIIFYLDKINFLYMMKNYKNKNLKLQFLFT
jgi:hypothetical protein